MKLTYRYLFFLFLKIGATSWGGFMALIAVIQKQMAELDHAIEEEEIVQAISLASVLPGAMAVNVVAYIGYKLRGVKGALVSMAGVLLPGFILMLLLSYLYFTYRDIPSFNRFFLGLIPAVVAILFNVAYTLATKNIKDVIQAVVAIASLVALLFLHSAFITIFVILASAVTGYFVYRKPADSNASALSFSWFRFNKMRVKMYSVYALASLLLAAALYWLSFNNNSSLHMYSKIVTTFSGLSLSQFGGGYVVIPSMQKIIVDGLHWLSQQQFTDAIAMGQITPGPIYISAVFIGYKLCGMVGAFVATIAMFLPAAMLMLLCARFMNAIAKAPFVIASFKGIRAAITGMIAAAGILLLYNAKGAVLPLLILFAICFFVSYQYKITPVILIPLAGIAGFFIF